MRILLVSMLVMLPWVAFAENKATTGSAPARSIEARQGKVPKLLILVVFDQLRGDFVSKWSELFGTTGFNRLKEQGAWFSNCHYPYSMTVTGAGHATMGTGCLPSQHGIVENDWYERTLPGEVYCAPFGDRYRMIPEGAKSKSGKSQGGAPDRLLVPTVGDYVKTSTQGQGKVIGLSMKDRGGVLPAGKKADICYWFDGSTGAFVTSNRYTDALPSYMQAFNA
ncbi:MAG TPA: alkaline phosphatase family protein, partial [Gemmatales bacterium]|nr:alkaline phosphatase family protein [Gemmatales bacterium]